jgi:acetylcholinesterase
VTDEELQQLTALYSEDPSQGSPYNTGDSNALSLQFKRIASYQGDVFFQAPRRFLLNKTSQNQPAWSYSKSDKRVNQRSLSDYLYSQQEIERATTSWIRKFSTLLAVQQPLNILDP